MANHIIRTALATCMVLAPSAAFAQSPPTPLVASGNRFGSELLAAVDAPKTNRFLSPFSVRTALAMTSLGADGQTLDQMNATLGFADRDQAGAFGRMGGSLVAQHAGTDSTLSVANRIWIDRRFPILDTFKSACRQDFGAEAESADFASSPDSERGKINQWVSDQTQGKIDELFQPGTIDSMTRMVLANAIYFKADWKHPFSTDATTDGQFRQADGTTAQARLMQQESRLAYGEDADFQVLEMPYSDEKLSMVVLLPKDPAAMPPASAWLSDAAKLQSLESRQVVVTLPKFTIRTQLDLSGPLKKLGMTDAFDAETADFRRMSSGGRLFISAVVHEAFIEVDETGTEAAAATGVAMTFKMAPKDPPVVFQADRPFWFFIRDIQSGTVLFVGRLSKL
ncbi:MAG: serpin family protein [Chthoniobacterales bacterium]